MTTSKINRAIRHLGLEIVHERGAGYSYFLDLISKHQVGEAVYACYLNHLTLEEWAKAAQVAKDSAK
jgi:hypothetical protein